MNVLFVGNVRVLVFPLHVIQLVSKAVDCTTQAQVGKNISFAHVRAQLCRVAARPHSDTELKLVFIHSLQLSKYMKAHQNLLD